MYEYIYVGLHFLILNLLSVNSMSIKGPVLTRYDPCGNSALYFNRISDKLWQGIVTLDTKEREAGSEIEVHFKQQMIIYQNSLNSTIIVSNNWHDFKIRPNVEMPPIYTFNVYINETIPEDVPFVTKFSVNNVTLCDDTIKMTQTVESFNVTKENDIHYHHVCGRRALDNAELTSLRTDAKPGDWPWHVAIFFKDPYTDEWLYQCGGNIISETAVLTAGHCLFLNGNEIPASRFKVDAGVSDIKDYSHIGRQTFVPEKIILHPAYNDLATSDLAIFIVKKFKFTEFVQPICIWGPVYDKTALFGKEAVVVGFGKTEQNIFSDNLRATNIMVQNDTTCLAYDFDLYTTLLNEFTICAGYGPTVGINPRNGDSGGGLVVPTMQPDKKVTWYLRGVFSKCGLFPPSKECDPTFYVVYTDVGPHYSWIYHHAGLVYQTNIYQ